MVGRGAMLVALLASMQAGAADLPASGHMTYVGPAGSLPGAVATILDADAAKCRARADKVPFERRTYVISACLQQAIILRNRAR